MRWLSIVVLCNISIFTIDLHEKQILSNDKQKEPTHQGRCLLTLNNRTHCAAMLFKLALFFIDFPAAEAFHKYFAF